MKINYKNMSIFYSNYLTLFVYFFICSLITVVLFTLVNFISYYNPNIEKLSSYECGFDPYDDARNVFDIQFYLVAILFLIFDIETIYLFPGSVAISFLNPTAIWTILDFYIELLIGYVYIYNLSVLDWH
jgi:NADH-quinone oxidoreductase subunit A